MGVDLSVNYNTYDDFETNSAIYLIPVLCLITLIVTSALERFEITNIFWWVLGVYIVGGLFLLFTKYQQAGRALLWSAGVIICLGMVAFIFIVIAVAGSC